jgi:hypothetical protein
MVADLTRHPMGEIEDAGFYLESRIEGGDDCLCQDFFNPAPVGMDGRGQNPERPGWRVEINETWLEGASYRKSELD